MLQTVYMGTDELQYLKGFLDSVYLKILRLFYKSHECLLIKVVQLLIPSFQFEILVSNLHIYEPFRFFQEIQENVKVVW